MVTEDLQPRGVNCYIVTPSIGRGAQIARMVEHSFTGRAGVTSVNEQEDVIDQTTCQSDGYDKYSNDDEYLTQQSVMLDLVKQMGQEIGHGIVSSLSASNITPSKVSADTVPVCMPD